MSRPSLFRFWQILRQAGAATRNVVGALALSALGLVGIANFEGYKSTTYLDQVAKPTLGFGTTEGVKPGDQTTPQRALQRLLKDADKASAGVRRCITVPLTQGEFDAYVSLSYNVGSGAFCTSSIPRKLAALDYPAACATILEFDKLRDCSRPKVRNAKTGQMECPLVTSAGLAKRRQGEYRMCVGGDAPTQTAAGAAP